MTMLMICSLIYLIIITIIYFSKKRLSSNENNLFKMLMILSIWGLSIELLCVFFVKEYEVYTLMANIITRLLLIYYFVWNTLFTTYVMLVCTKDDKEDSIIKNMKLIGTILTVIFTIVIIIMPMYFHNTEEQIYSYGPGVILTNITFISYEIIWIYLLLTNKEKKNKKLIPIYIFIILGSILGLIQKAYPYITIMTSFESLVVFLMYFTIENPDLKMLEELKKNRYLTMQNVEDKSNFLFNMTGEVSSPIKEIDKALVSDLKDSEKLEFIKEKINYLNFAMDNLLNISDLKINNNIKNKYDLKKLLKKIELLTKAKVNENVALRFIYSKDLPDTIYGNEDILKQILVTILNNSVKYTKNGFIELKLESIIKYDAIRLIFTIEDSGSGMSIDKINKLMDYNEVLTDDEVKMLDKINLNISLVGKLIRYIGGNFYIKSENGKGTTFTIVIDEKCLNKEDEYTKKVSKVESNKKVLLVSDNKKNIDTIKSYFNNNEVILVNTFDGKDAVLKVQNKEIFDLIIIEENIKNDSGYNIMQNIIKENKKCKCIILINSTKESMLKHLLEDGFKDYLYEDKLGSELERISKKYL